MGARVSFMLILRSSLALNSQVSLVVDQTGEQIFAMSEEQCTLLHHRELCSFGSGTWYDGADAVECMESDGKWISCCFTFGTPIILEKKGIFTHLQTLSCLDKAVRLRELLTLLEDAGEALALYIMCMAKQ